MQSDSFEQVRVRVLPDGRMDEENAAKYLGWKPKTLANKRCLGKGGPAFVKVGGRVFYKKNDLDQFIASGEERAA